MEFDNLTIRHVRPEEHGALIRFWTEHFSLDEQLVFSYDCFSRIMMQPWYRDEDCLVAVEAGEIVASVLAERRTYEWRGMPVRCGAVSQVAAAGKLRHKGVATELLRRSVEAMETDKVAFSALWTAEPAMYERLGWEPVALPRFRVPTSKYEGLVHFSESGLDPLPAVVPRLYETCPHRELHFPRPSIYLQTYASWAWASDRQGAAILVAPRDAGYAVVSLRGRDEVFVWEACSEGAASELLLIRAAAKWARKRGRAVVSFGFLPQHLDLSYLIAIERFERAGCLIRRVAMREKAFSDLKKALVAGTAVMWDTDEF